MTESAAEPAPAKSSQNRRTLMVASVLLALAAAGLWGASRMTWVTMWVTDGLAVPRQEKVAGSQWSPLLMAIALVFVAGILAAIALRGWALRIAAVILAIAAIVVAMPAISLLSEQAVSGYAAKAIDLPARFKVGEVEKSTLGAWLALVAVLVAVAAAVILLRSVPRAAAMSSKYKSPAARRADLEEKVFAERNKKEPEDSGRPERELWDEQDSGHDPTDGR